MAGTFAGDKSMRVNYNAQGVDSYYLHTGGEYRNPHFAGIVVASQSVLEAWWSAAPHLPQLPAVRVLDLACGSGEATQALQQWWGSGSRGPAPRRLPRRPQPAPLGSEPPPQAAPIPDPAPSPQAAAPVPSLPTAPPRLSPPASPPPTSHPCPTTIPPPAPAMEPPAADSSTPVPEQQPQPSPPQPPQPPPSPSDNDSSAQASNASSAASRPPLHIDACDPYTYQAFEKRTGRAAERWSFQDIADGCLADRAYQLCICSYALHVLDDSKLFSLLMQLSLVTQHLIVLSPHKKPHIGAHTGWQLLQHSVEERVHAWLYESLNAQG